MAVLALTHPYYGGEGTVLTSCYIMLNTIVIAEPIYRDDFSKGKRTNEDNL